MGYGGDLIWTAAIRTFHMNTCKKPLLVYTPGLYDIIHGKFYNTRKSVATAPIFEGNPRCRTLPPATSSWWGLFLDRLFFKILRLFNLRKKFEVYVSKRFEVTHPELSPVFHLDMEIHSYAEAQTSTRCEWKSSSTAMEAILSGFLQEYNPDNVCELFWTEAERESVRAILQCNMLADGFIAIEPGTNTDYFGELRAWPYERWEQLVARLRVEFPTIPIAQLGTKKTPIIDGVVDLRGKTTFREAALLSGTARLFICTEGGLMHGACAAKANAVVLWGGVTSPSFAGYPDRMKIIHHSLPCIPCGLLGKCPRDILCMKNITVEEVYDACEGILRS